MSDEMVWTDEQAERTARLLFARTKEGRDGFSWPLNGERDRQHDIENARRFLSYVVGDLAEHDRAVAEATLLEAADAVLEPYPDPETCTKVFDPWDVDEFLRARIPQSVSTQSDQGAP